MIQNIEVGDKVRVAGEDGIHVVKSIAVTRLPLGWHAVVWFEDGDFGLVDSSGFTDLEKVETGD